MTPSRNEAWLQSRRLQLTPIEFTLLYRMASSPELPVTYGQFHEICTAEALGPRTIATHVYNLRRKLGKHRGLVEAVAGVGYRIAASHMPKKPSAARPPLAYGPVRLFSARREAWLHLKRLHLTPNAFSFLYRMARSPGSAFTYEQLVETYTSGSRDARTVRTHICAIRRSLGEHWALLETVPGVGYRLARVERTSIARRVGRRRGSYP